MGSTTGLLTRGSLPRRLPGLRQWLRGGGASPLTAAGPSRIRTGVPSPCSCLRSSLSSDGVRVFGAPLAARHRLGSADLRLLVGPRPRDRARRLGSRPPEDRACGRVRGARRAPRPRDRTGRARRRARHALRGQRRGPPVVRAGSPRLPARRRTRRCGRARRRRRLADGSRAATRMIKTPALAIELDALGDTRALWLAWLESARGVLDVDPDELPVDRADAAAALDDAGAGNWRTLLERFSEDHAPAFLRRDAATSARLQALVDDGATLGVFTDAPDELARTALAQLGASRRISALETGAGAFERLLDIIGGDATVVRTRTDLLYRA